MKNEITCPYCGHTMELEVPEQILVNDEIFMALKHHYLFNFACQRCGAISDFPYPVTFFSEKDQYIIKYTQGKVYAQLEAFITYNEENGIDISKEPPFDDENLKFRFVSTLQDVVEKINIIKGGYNDKIIELCKFMLVKKNELDDEKLIYKMTSYDNKLHFLANNKKRYELDGEEYKKMRDLYSKVKNKELDDEIIIDAEWAQKVMEEYENEKEYE